jgi:hypothetical protein
MEDKFTIAGEFRKREAERYRMAAGGCHLTGWCLIATAIGVWGATGRPVDCLPLVGMAIFMMLIAIFLQIHGFIEYGRRA